MNNSSWQVFFFVILFCNKLISLAVCLAKNQTYSAQSDNADSIYSVAVLMAGNETGAQMASNKIKTCEFILRALNICFRFFKKHQHKFDISMS